ncbi:MAG: thiamine pyrophosphate-dependent enzyme [Spirochaetota bacterium]
MSDVSGKTREPAWCPGCGNFSILDIVKRAVEELGIRAENLVVASGIGQAAKLPQYLEVNMFNGLHGRALPAATAIKASNPGLTVIAEGGDGDMYGEGGNHFIHAVRRNPDIAHLVHDNMVYGLTKGQASPTSERGFRTPVQVDGVIMEPINPIAVAISLGASFVARAFSGDVDETVEIVKKAILHRGYALVDILQPCVTFNGLNTFRWFKDHTRYLDSGYDPHDRAGAFATSIEGGKLALGIIYLGGEKPAFDEASGAYASDRRPLFRRSVDMSQLGRLAALVGLGR